LFFHINPLFDLIKGSGDIQWRVEWIKNHHKISKIYSFDIYNPTRGWALKPNFAPIIAPVFFKEN